MCHISCVRCVCCVHLLTVNASMQFFTSTSRPSSAPTPPACSSSAAAPARTEALLLQQWQSPGNLWGCAPFRHCRSTPLPATMNHESALAVEEAPSKRKRHRNRYQDGHLLQFRLAAWTAAVPRSRPGPCRCTEARSLPRWPSPGNLWGWPSATAAADQRRWIRLGRWAGWWRERHRKLPWWPPLTALPPPPLALSPSLLFRGAAAAAVAAAGVEAAAGEEEG